MPTITVTNLDLTDFQQGSFYGVLSGEEIGFEIVLCDDFTDTGFVGTCLEKCLDMADSIDKHYYRESTSAKVIDREEVKSELISVCLEANATQGYVYSVDKSEIEEMLVSINI